MATISLLTRIINAVQQQVDLSVNTLSVQGLQINGTTSGHITHFASATTTSYQIIWPSDQGTGLLTNDGSGNLTWAPAPATGANPTLSNLTAPTAVNQDLLPGSSSGSLYGWQNLGSQTQPWGGNSYISDLGTFEIDIYDGSTPSFSNYMGEIAGNYSFAATIGSSLSGSADLSVVSNPGAGGNVAGLLLGSFAVATPSTNSGNILLSTGDANGSASNSGDIVLRPGSATGSRGKIQIKDGSEGTAGSIWTSTDTVGSGHWAAAPVTGANTALSNLTTTSINTNLIPNAGNTYIVGDHGSLHGWAEVDTTSIVFGTTAEAFPNNLRSKIITAESTNLGTGATLSNPGLTITTYPFSTVSETLGSRDIILQSVNNYLGNIWLGTGIGSAVASGNVSIFSGNATGTGDTGNISLTIGTVAGGSAGKIQLQDPSMGTAGYIWTSTDTVGSGHWAAPAVTGANRALSNLTTTAINTSLIPNAAGAYTLGSSTDPWATLYNTQNFFIDGTPITRAFMDTGNSSPLGNGTTVADPALRISSTFGTGTTNDIVMQTARFTAGNLWLGTGGPQGSPSINSGNVSIFTGQGSGAGSNSGNILLNPGTAPSATRGKIQFQDGSEGSAGQIWTSADTVGGGHWAAASADLPLAGGTMSGAINLGGFTPTNSGTAVNPNDLVNKSYVDNFINATSWKTAVLLATTANITLSGEQTIDGTLTSSSRVLVKNQSTASQNGIYTSNSGAWTRSADMNLWSAFPAAAVFVESGTVNADLGFVCTAQPGGTLGTTAVTWVQFSSAGSYTADSITLQLLSGVFSVKTAGIALANMANLPANTIIGNNTGSSATPLALTQAQVTAMLNVFSASLQGLVPASGGGTTNFLRADGTWAVAGTGTVTSVGLSVPASSIFGVTGSPVTVSGTLGLTTTGTSGGIPYFSSASAMSSSGVLSANALILGGGAGASPTSLSAGTVNTLLHGNASGAPTWSAVVAADMSSGAAAAGTLATANGSGGVTYVAPANQFVIPFTAGVAFAANTSFAVRFAIQASAETVSTAYKADNVASTTDNFWVIGLGLSTTSVSIGGTIPVTTGGMFTLGSSDTLFNTTDIGHPVFLGTSGGFTTTAPTASQTSVYKIGMVFSTTQILLDRQHIGVN